MRVRVYTLVNITFETAPPSAATVALSATFLVSAVFSAIFVNLTDLRVHISVECRYLPGSGCECDPERYVFGRFIVEG